jgi:hypothetical protein
MNVFKTYYGPTMNAFEAAEKTGSASKLEAELEALFNSQNKAADQNTTSIPASFLKGNGAGSKAGECRVMRLLKGIPALTC